MRNDRRGGVKKIRGRDRKRKGAKEDNVEPWRKGKEHEMNKERWNISKKSSHTVMKERKTETSR